MKRKLTALCSAAFMLQLPFQVSAEADDARFDALERSLAQTRIILVVVSVVTIVLAAVLLTGFLKSRKVEPPPKPEKENQPHMTVALERRKENPIGTLLSSMSTRILFRESREKKIVLTAVTDPTHVIEISSGKQTVIGRNQSMADVVIYNERSVSQKHCRIFSRNSRVYVEDLDSLNHTFVDGEEISEETELFSGAVLKIGRLSFNVRIENA